MLKKLLTISYCLLLQTTVFSQNFFSNTFGDGTGNTPNTIFGWGLNFNSAIDSRPNFNATYGSLMINYHTGITLSAHSNYGGIRFYNQGYPNAYDVNTGSVMVMSIVNNSVGIGTTTPNSALDIASGAMHVQGGYGANYGLDGSYHAWNISGGGGETNFVNNIGGGTIGGFTFDNTNRSNASTRLMTILGNGYVGIGTSTPTQALTVNGTVAANHAGLQGNLGISSDVDARIYMLNTTSGQNWNLISETNGSFEIGIFGSSPFQTITSSGNVGIGTTSPGSALTIKSATTGVSIEPGSGNYFGTLAFNRESRTGAIFNPSGNAFQINNGGNDQNLHIQVYHGDGSLVTNNAFVIAGASGNVGIGTTDNAAGWQLASSPYKLAVGGSMIAEQVTVKLQAAWPDYVFKPNYTLPSLTQVKTYIDKNQHLPEMPSEQEIAEKGLNLGEMNKLLVKKVEELTLYLMEKDKQVNTLSEKLQQQAEQLQKLQHEFETLRKQ